MIVRRFSLCFLLMSCALALLACASGPRTIELPQERIEAGLARRFPFEARIGGLFSFRMALPRLTLQPESNRMRLEFVVDASEPSMRSPLQGDLAVTFALRFEPRDSSIRLVNARVEHMDVPQLPTRWRELLSRNGPALVEPILENLVVHTFKPEDLARAPGLAPGPIRVTRRGIAIDLVAAP